jgi:hypothetical protein
MSNKLVCHTTHPQILAGCCPWCGAPIGDQPFATRPHTQAAAERRWNIVRLKSDLDHPDLGVRLITVHNAGVHMRAVPEAVDVLRMALDNSVESVPDRAAHALAERGGKIAADAVEEYEVASGRQPDDLALRVLLLGYYFLARFVSDAARMACQAHVLWIIEHASASHIAGSHYVGLDKHMDGEAYKQGRKLWMEHVDAHPVNTAILGNAARFLSCSDKAKCGELLRRARSLEPDNPEWSRRLGHLYSLQMTGKDAAARQDWAAMAQAEYEKGQGLYRDERERLGQLPRLAEAAFEAGDYAKAHAYASELLSQADAGDSETAIFYANQVLGSLALVDGDVERANGHLLASAETKGSPVLRSFGPSMVLAKKLLARGERDVVLRYLDLCSLFWQYGADRIARWTGAIEQGEIPDFGLRK